MAHKDQKTFCIMVKLLYPDSFIEKNVFDGGSLDVNGNNRYLFKDCTYIGCDVGEGENVDVVSKIDEYKGDDESFDTIITTECLEHDEHYVKSIRNMIRMLKTNGLFMMTCASTGRPEHGTNRTDGNFSCPVLNTDYYKNLTEQDIKDALPSIVESEFSDFKFIYNPKAKDLYFWGIKK